VTVAGTAATFAGVVCIAVSLRGRSPAMPGPTRLRAMMLAEALADLDATARDFAPCR
jgi:hypothetical protein